MKLFFSSFLFVLPILSMMDRHGLAVAEVSNSIRGGSGTSNKKAEVSNFDLRRNLSLFRSVVGRSDSSDSSESSSSSESTPSVCSPVTSTAELVEAINGATDPANPSEICVDVTQTPLVFDQTVVNTGLDLSGKYFRATCTGYDATTKCILERSGSMGHFASCTAPASFSFEGFTFQNGLAGGDIGGGGAVEVTDSGSSEGGEANFTACDFITNTALGEGSFGGAFAVKEIVSDTWNLSFEGCTFDSNDGATQDQVVSIPDGDSIHANVTSPGNFSLSVDSCNFASEDDDIFFIGRPRDISVTCVNSTNAIFIFLRTNGNQAFFPCESV